MKRLSTLLTLLCLFGGIAVTIIPRPASAIGQEAPVIISEFQTGAGTASDEFVELYNQSDQPVDITGWEVRFINPTSGPLLLARVPTDVPITLAVHEYYIFSTASLSSLTVSGQRYTSGLSKTDKILALFAADVVHCRLAVQDAVAWQSTALITNGEGVPIQVPSDSVNKDKLFRRYQDASGSYIDSNNNASDFQLTAAVADAVRPGIAQSATPGASNTLLVTADIPPAGTTSSLAPLILSGCTNPSPVPTPSAGSGTTAGSAMLQPQITEILPNPASPQTDDKDEFVELYNPNDEPLDISSYILEVGLTTKRRYIFPPGSVIQTKAYAVFFSVVTHISIANSGGQVRLLDPSGAVVSQTDQYGAAKDNRAWAAIDGVWQWTAGPTPGAANTLQTPPEETAKSISAAVPTKKTTTKAAKAVKSAAKPPKSAAKTSKTQTSRVETVAAVSPDKGSLHTGVLATVAVFALLYGAYEYRHDLADKVHQFRTNRANRRAAGSEFARRGSRGVG